MSHFTTVVSLCAQLTRDLLATAKVIDCVICVLSQTSTT